MGKIRHSDGFTAYERQMMALAWACLAFWGAGAMRKEPLFLDAAGGRLCLLAWGRILERTGLVWSGARRGIDEDG